MYLQYMDRVNPMDKHMEVMINCYGLEAAPGAPQMFGNAGREHMEKYGNPSLCPMCQSMKWLWTCEFKSYDVYW